MTTIKGQHKKAIEKICIAMRLVNITTPVMRKHGSIRLYDPVTEVQYSLHESGYVRRYIKSGWPYSLDHYKSYQLNTTGKLDGSTYRILATIDEQIVILINAVANYRGTIQNRQYGN